MNKILKSMIVAGLAAGFAATGTVSAQAASDTTAAVELQDPGQSITHITEDYRCTTQYLEHKSAGFRQEMTEMSCSWIKPGVEVRAGMTNESGGWDGNYTPWIGSDQYRYVFTSGWGSPDIDIREVKYRTFIQAR